MTRGMVEPTGWSDDAPDPHAVIARVGALVARQVQSLTADELRWSDHTDRMRLILAADFCFTFFDHMACYYTPDSAVPVANLHKEFARMTLRISIQEPDTAAVAKLTALADRSFEARGRICEMCRLPNCLHATPHPPESSN